MIVKKTPWVFQPPLPVKLNSEFGVVRAWYGNTAALDQPAPTYYGTNGFKLTRYGASNDFTGGGNGSLRWQNSPGISSTLGSGITLVAIAIPNSLASEISVCGVSSTANNNPWVRLEFRPDLSNTWNLQYGNDSGSYTNVNGGTAAAGQADIVVGIWRAGTGEKSIWVNGSKKNSTTTDRGTTTITQFEVGTLWRTTPVQHFNGTIPLAVLINRPLSDPEIALISANPWLLLKPKTTSIYFTSPGGSYTLTAANGTYSVSGQTSSILKSKVISANYGTYTLTGQNAGVYKNRVLTAAFGSYSLTGQSATIAWAPAGGYTLVADKGDYTYTGQTATLKRNKLINAVNGTYSVTGQNANIAYSGANTITLKAGSWLRYRIIQ